MESEKVEKTVFEIERDRRLKIISDKSLWRLLRDRVQINGRPIAHRTARDAFKLDSFDELSGVQLRVWLASEDVINEYLKNLENYGIDLKKVEPSTTN